ncbi:MAG: hypothetical protein KKD28_02370 [Chloroflexi bacterium]|nr:hypothetical protein [Chloroflexota bacterium]MBU1660301.1 hypothetical protein [Chloroflexota bacterium]
MKTSKVWLTLIIIVLTACRAGGYVPHGIEGSLRLGTATPGISLYLDEWATESYTIMLPLVAKGGASTPASTPTPAPAVTSTLTATPALTVTPEITATAGVISPTITPTITITSSPAITSTPALSETVVITTTTSQTSTLVFTEVVVLQNGTINQVAWSPDGEMFAAATSVGIYLYDAKTLEITRRFDVGEPVNSVTFSPNKGLLVSGGLNADIRWRDPNNGQFLGTFDGHLLGVTDLALPAPGNILASGSDDGTVRVWGTANIIASGSGAGEVLHILRDAANRVTSIDISRDGQVLSAGSFQKVCLWDPTSGELLDTIAGLTGWVNDVALSPDGRILAVADSNSRIQLWDTSTGKQTHNIPIEQTGQILALAFSPDGGMLALGCQDGSVLLWDVAGNSLKVPTEKHEYAVTSLMFSPGGSILLTGSVDGTVGVWSE